ncbi:MAG: hypothetical protein U9N45_00635 [Gemmatimonadota bacterium]|nr:hypothetical protein [Gemmatimonadota bacterium]
MAYTHDDSSTVRARAAKLVCLFFFAVAMGYLEAAVVVYLRELFYPEGFSFPLRMIESHTLAVEIGREFVTMVMLFTVAWVAGKIFYERLAFFLMVFGVWDIFYYIWLKVLLGWPAGLAAWDLLFLIPVPWIGPVYSPVAVSLGMITGAGLVLRRLWSGGVFRPGLREWAIVAGGALLIFLSYVTDQDAGTRFAMPGPYRWDLLAVGLAAGLYAVIRSLLRTGKEKEPEN